MQEITLANGVKLPIIGYGTGRVTESELCVASVKQALSCGYKHIDTASVYQNERSIGKALAESGINRDEIFITSKLHNTEHTYERALKAFEHSLQRLGLDYLDMYLIHWPVPSAFRDNWEQANAEAWRAMEELYERGKIRAIGVSNFKPHHIDALMKTAKIKPMVNQIELHPGLLRTDITDYCTQNGIAVEAWAPFAMGLVFKLPELKQLARKYNRPASQVLLRWFIQKGIAALPKSTTPERIVENICVFDFEIIEQDSALLDCVKDSRLELKHDSDKTDFVI